MTDTNCEKEKRMQHDFRNYDSLRRTMLSHIRAWEKAGIIPRIYRGEVVEDEEKK